MTNQMDRTYQRLIQRLQKRIDEVDKRLFSLGGSLLDVANALQSLHDSFQSLSNFLDAIIDAAEKQNKEGNRHKPAIMFYVFHHDLEEFVEKVNKCRKAINKFVEVTKDEEDESNKLKGLAKVSDDALKPIEKCSVVLNGEYTYDENGKSKKGATGTQMTEVYDTLINYERIIELNEVITASNNVYDV